MSRRIRLFLGSKATCSYIADRDMANAYADPEISYDKRLHSSLNAMGFRRSSGFLYQPHCGSCKACQSLRLPVAEFHSKRRHRRILRRNADVTMRWRPGEYRDYHYQLYERYLNSRHANGGMDDSDPQKYREFLISPWANTRLLEFRYSIAEPESSTRPGSRSELLGVAVMDELSDGLSAVYSFYDPELTARSPGTLMILKMVEATQALGLPHLYLGYWAAEASRMTYKSDFTPLQLFDGQHWKSYRAGEPLPAERQI